MNNPSHKIMILVGLLTIFGQQTVSADNRQSSHRDAPVRQMQNARVPHKAQVEQHFDRHHNIPSPAYNHYYKPSYRINPLPHGYKRILVNAAEYFFFDGFFYRPSHNGYVIVDAPIGAIVASLPMLHHIFQWRGEPYYVVGNTFYRRHPRGYVVVPDPGYGYRR